MSTALHNAGVSLLSATETLENIDSAPVAEFIREISAALHEAQYEHLRGPRRRRAAHAA
jgi:hypothetical protein